MTLIGVFPPLAPLAERLWASIHDAAPLAWCIEAVPSRAGPRLLRATIGGSERAPGNLHYTELVAMNPAFALGGIEWGDL